MQGTDARIAELVARIDEAIAGDRDWRRDVDQEAWLRERKSAELLCYEGAVPGVGGRVRVWVDAGHGRFSVTTIQPLEGGEWDFDEHNRVVEEFHDRWVAPVARELDLTLTLSPADFSMRTVLGDRLVSLLEGFSRSARDSFGTSRLEEREGWLAFVTEAHRSHVELDAFMLARWLREEGGFSVDEAFDLSRRYQNARDLLRWYDRAAA